MRIVQKNEFRIAGMSRSGNHAIINWIIRQINGQYLFLNCAEPKFNPYLSARPLDHMGKVYQTNINDFDLQKEQERIFSSKDYLLYNYEDCFLGPLNNKTQKAERKDWVGLSECKKDILILRDPFNMYASRLKAGFIRGHSRQHRKGLNTDSTLRRIYKQHAREFISEKNYLKNKVCVKFNSWSTDKDYRKNVAAQLNIPFTDEGFKEVSSVAGGSSFDGIDHSGKASKMEVNSRWKKFADDEEYWSFFDSELIELTRIIFGEIPPVEFYLENKIQASIPV